MREPLPPRRNPAAEAEQQQRKKGWVLAVAMHGLLAVLLLVGLNWNTRTPAPVQVELFTPEAPNHQAPSAPPPPAAPSETANAEPARILQPPPELKTEQAKQREKEAQDKEAQDKLAQQKAAQEKAERKKADQEKTKKLAAEKAAAQARAEEERAEREATQKEEAAAKKLAAKQAAEKKMIDDLRRSAGAPSGERQGSANGVADADYQARLRAALRRNTTLSSDISGNPKAVFLVQLRADCSVVNVKRVRSSGVERWDDAAERGILRTNPMPKPTEGPCPSSLEISHSPHLAD